MDSVAMARSHVVARTSSLRRRPFARGAGEDILPAMSNDPRRRAADPEHDDDRKRDDAPRPTRFGRERRALRPWTAGVRPAPGESRPAVEDEGPFEDDGRL
jgi:hypothetical protein